MFDIPQFDAQTMAQLGLFSGVMGTLFFLCVLVIYIVSFWLIFEKSGRPGWLCLIPIVNIVVWLHIAGKSGWYLLLFFIPIVGTILWVATIIDFARSFRHSTAFGVALLVFPPIFYIIIAFDASEYRKLGEQRKARV